MEKQEALDYLKLAADEEIHSSKIITPTLNAAFERFLADRPDKQTFSAVMSNVRLTADMLWLLWTTKFEE